jgi:hypothetical protein
MSGPPCLAARSDPPCRRLAERCAPVDTGHLRRTVPSTASVMRRAVSGRVAAVHSMTVAR